jgi:hypothetical protein
MKGASISGAIVLTLFGLPFLGMGVAFMWQSAGRGASQGWIGVIFGAFFAGIGLLLITAAVEGVRMGKQQAATRAANPDKPWLWRKDWAEGRANGGDPRANIAAWIFTAFWDVLSGMFAFTVLPKLLNAGDPKAILAAILPLAGIAITAFTLRGTMRIRKYGRTSFWCDSVPFIPGGRLKGAIHLKLPASVPHGIDLRLSCKRRIVTGAGKERSVNEVVLWQEEKNLPAESVLRGPQDAQAPVEFMLPGGACETDDESPDDRVYWQLRARADVPGVDFSDHYELPVFRTQTPAGTESQPAESRESSPESFVAQPRDAFPEAELPAPAPAATHIVYREDARGIGFYFPPLRNRLQALEVVVFAAIWSAAVYFLWIDRHAPWMFRIVFSMSELLVGYILVSVVFGSTSLGVAEGVLRIRKAILGVGRRRLIPLHEVASILPLSQGRAGSSGEVLYGISVRQCDGREIRIAADSLSAVEARWVVSTLERAMGRRQDTRVQFESIYGAPPQPRPEGARAGHVNVPLRQTRSPRAIGAVGVVVWLLFMGSIFYRGFSHSAVRRAARSSSRASSRAAVLQTPMTGEDAAGISGLPVQRQAEELLARSIGHDARALEMFTNRIEDWTGQVRLSDRMKQLDTQAAYSTDLRVRQADADLWLAMEGWRRNREAVDALLQRAERDRQFRPSAYYFLGMEGGSGIDTAHAFAVLREHALNDPDPADRQWSVEGLRFFKSDEALDVLFQVFTRDASFVVRDRAGCNLSDCGIFTRAQRMRLAPRLIELADDRTLSRQMRDWVFMALREITDTSLPDEAGAWRTWYEQHGREKAAQFEALPWYQVRGDQ